MNLYTIKDTLANRCGPVFQSVNHKTAMRATRQMLEKVDPIDFPEFQLLFIGTFNEESGVIVSIQPEIINLEEKVNVSIV